MSFHIRLRLICGLCLSVLLLSSGVFAEDFFRCNFSTVEGMNGDRTIAPSYFNKVRDHQSVTGGGFSSRGMIFAMENLQDFKLVAREPLKSPLPALVYTGLKNFPAQKGFCEIWIAPYFNQEFAWRNKKNPNMRLNYILTLYNHTPGTPLSKRADKSELNMYILNKQLGVRFAFTDGTTSTLSVPVKKWSPRSWHKITLCWEPGIQRLYIDRKLVKVNRKNGTLGSFNALELGGRDHNASFQGVIDDIVIAPGSPADTVPYGFDGDLQKFPRITVPENSLKNWKVNQPQAELSVSIKNNYPVFSYKGGREYPLYAGMEQSLPVQEGTYIRTDIVFHKTAWNYGSRAAFFLEFLNAAGKRVRLNRIDSNVLGPAYRPMPLTELSSLTAIKRDVAYFNYFQVPPQSRSVRLVASMEGNPAEIILKKWALRQVDQSLEPWFQQPVAGRQLTYENSPAVSDDEVRKMLKERKASVSELVRCGDRIEWQIDGRKVPPAIIHNPITGLYSRITKFREIGFRFATTTVFLGHSPYIDDYDQIWLDDDSFDLKALEKAVLRVLREAPDAYVILNIFVCPNAKWLKNNRSELQIHPDGNPIIMKNCAVKNQSSAEFPAKRGESWVPSIHSAKYRQDISAVLEKLFREFEKTDAAKAVVGVYVTGGDDGQFRAPPGPDMSPLTLPAFQKFLQKKYGTLEKISAAWKKNITAWQEIKLPTAGQLDTPKKVIYSENGPTIESDYKDFISHECLKLKMDLRAAVKKGAPRMLVGGYENAMGFSGSSYYGKGRFNMPEIIRDPNCDFLISLSTYGRERDECFIPLGLRAYTGSTRLHKKLIITELDIRNPKQPKLTGRNLVSHNWQVCHDYRTFSEVLKICAGYSAAWGGMFHAYAMGRFWYDTPEAISAWKNAAEIAAKAPGEKLSGDRIAWICGEKFCNYFTQSVRSEITAITWSRNVVVSLWLSQIRFDSYLPDDLWHPDFKAPKIMMISSVSVITPEEIRKIRKHFLKDGRILVWLGTPSTFSGIPLNKISDAIGFRLTQPKEIRDRSIFVDKTTHPVLENTAGFLYSPITEQPVVHFNNSAVIPGKEDLVLARYHGTGHPGIVLRKHKDSTEIFIGQHGAVSPRMIRNIAKIANIKPVTDGDDLMIRGGGLIIIGASTADGIRKVFYPEGVTALECITGQKIIKSGKDFLEVYLKYGECAVFRHKKDKQ